MNRRPSVKIFCAVDTPAMPRAIFLAALLQEAGAGIKLGLEFFNANGPSGVAAIRDRFPDLPLFLDLKLHDIPNTVAGSVRALAALYPDYLNVHASGGADMMRAACEAASDAAAIRNIRLPRMIAVTVLTSMDAATVASVGWTDGADAQVLRLASLARDAGMAGVVCSPREIAVLRENLGHEMVLITPGIRPDGLASGDQARVMTPVNALRLGATHLVIGRPITDADDPATALRRILDNIALG